MLGRARARHPPRRHAAGRAHAYLPDETRATARQVVATVVAEIEARLRRPHPPGGARRARPPAAHPPARGRATSTGTARSGPTCATGCPSTGRSCPSTSSGFGRHQRSLARDVVIAIDQSGSMAERRRLRLGVGRVLAPAAALRTSVVAFDTAVVDLTDAARRSGRRAVRHPARRRHRHQPGRGLLRGARHPAGRHRAGPGQRPVRGRPSPASCSARLAALVRDGRHCVVLLALSDEGAPAHDHAGRRCSPRSAYRASPARPTPSPTCWPPRSSAATSAAGPDGRQRLRRARLGPDLELAERGDVESMPGSFGRPSTRSPTMLRITSSRPAGDAHARGAEDERAQA